MNDLVLVLCSLEIGKQIVSVPNKCKNKRIYCCVLTKKILLDNNLLTTTSNALSLIYVIQITSTEDFVLNFKIGSNCNGYTLSLNGAKYNINI